MPLLKTIAGAVVGEAVGRKRGSGILGMGLGIVATRIATRSIPGALAVGGVLLAKTLYDRRKSKNESKPKKITQDT
jgi:flavin-dependent dehydrogenase